MTHEEAIETIKRNCTEGSQLREACAMFIPELAESEDERIRKTLLRCCDDWDKGQFVCMKKEDVASIRAYLEKNEEPKWSPSEGEMGVLYKLCYISNQITDEDDTELTRLYQDLKREYFNGHSFENMFSNEKQKEQKPVARENDFVSKPQTSVEILRHYLVWAENSEEEDCPYTWKALADAIRDGIKALEEQQPLMSDGEIEDTKRDIVAAIRKYYSADYAEYLTSFLKELSPEDNSEDEYGQKCLVSHIS